MGVVRSGKKWGVRIYVPYSQLTPEERAKAKGRRGRQRWVGTRNTYAEACLLEEEASAQVRAGRAPETCDEFADRWLRDFPRPAASTNDSYAQVAKMFARDFKGVPLTEVSRSDAREWVAGSAYRVNAMRAMMNDALNDELVTRNPFSSLGLPQSRGRRDLIPLTTEEVDRLVECAVRVHPGELGLTLRAICLLVAYCGLRPGEAFALERDDIDWKAKRITVWEGIDRKGRRAKPKKKKPRQHVLHPRAAEAIRAVPRKPRVDVLLPRPDGSPFSGPRFLHHWGPIRAAFEAGLTDHRRRQLQASRPERAKGIEPYELRHACGHWVLAETRDVFDTSVYMGHSDGGKEVIRTYGHPSHSDALDRVAARFSANVTPLRAVDPEEREEKSG